MLNLRDEFVQEQDLEEYSSSESLVDEDDENGVLVLSANNFADVVKSHQHVLVEFFAPWCTHCQALAPEYSKAAVALKETGVVLAKVDAIEHGDLADDYGVEAYPTLYFFVDGEKKPYNGGRTSYDIINWVMKRIGPAVSIVESAEELLERDAPLAVAYLDSVKGADAEEFIAVAKQEDGVEFHMTADAQIAKKFGLENKTPGLVLLKKQNEKVAIFDGSFQRTSIGNFVSENKRPLVIPFSRKTASLIFKSNVKRQLLLFANIADFEKIRANYEEAAKSFKKKIVFALINLSDEDVATSILDFFALDNERTRLLGFVSESGTKYLYDGDYSLDSLKQFSEKFLAGDLTPYRKSQKAPEENAGPVKIVVASTFEQIVLDKTKDVILEVYAPWCGRCKSLEPEYNKLGEALENISSIVIAKMDGTKNELERFKIEEYPTILFFPAGDKSDQPASLETVRTAAGFVKFLKSNAKVPFEAPDIPEPESEDESEESVVKEEEAGQVEENDTKDEL